MTITIMRGIPIVALVALGITLGGCASSLAGLAGGNGGDDNSKTASASTDGGNDGGDGNSGDNDDTTVQNVGWGANDQYQLLSDKDFTVTTDSQDKVTGITVNGKTYDRNCASGKDGGTVCEDADGNWSEVNTSDFDYLKVVTWGQAGSDEPEASLIGGEEKDRTENMPTQGQASYDGSFRMRSVSSSGENGAMKGKASLSVDFGTGEVTGKLHSFEDGNSGDSISGEADLVNGRVENNTMHADLSGQLRGETIDEDGSHMNGAFFGPNAEEVGGGLVIRTQEGSRGWGTWGARKQ